MHHLLLIPFAAAGLFVIAEGDHDAVRLIALAVALVFGGLWLLADHLPEINERRKAFRAKYRAVRWPHGRSAPIVVNMERRPHPTRFTPGDVLVYDSPPDGVQLLPAGARVQLEVYDAAH